MCLMITVCLNHSSILRSACAKGKKVFMGWHGEFKIHVKFMDEETDPEIRPGTTLKVICLIIRTADAS